ncbi:MAG: hypothetical protein IT267_04305 [Saprospiraceae bacterium]|nr:hypothetical protein [Saprospiraceae bacterium]
MLKFLYNTGILLYYGVLWVLSFFHQKAGFWINGRRGSLGRLAKIRKPEERWFWFHSSSMGEYEDSVEIAQSICSKLPDYKVLLTLSSPSAYEELKESPLYHHVMYLPLDTRSNARKFLNILRPEFTIFSRSDLWINLLAEVRSRKIKAYLLALRMSDKSGFLKRPMILLYHDCFQAFEHIYCQTERTLELLRNRFNIHHTSFLGNPRIHRIVREKNKNIFFPKIEEFVKDHFTLIGGSVLEYDLKAIRSHLDFILQSKVKLILVPHEIIEAEILELSSWKPEITIRFSKIDALNPNHRILIVDNVGTLRHIYRYCNLAIIGGGFANIGIHSIIEPAVYGIKPIFGPHHKNYPEVEYYLHHKLAEVYNNADELLTILQSEFAIKDNTNRKDGFKKYFETHTPDIEKVTNDVWRRLDNNLYKSEY